MEKIDFFNSSNLCVIPVHARSKKPKPMKWQNRNVDQNDASEFLADDNIGVVLGRASNGLVDIDLDSDLARKLAPYFLPQTGWIFGRRHAPRSHYIFRTSGEPGSGRKFDIGGKFAEYRANGQMTVFPPSVHEAGEPIEWATCDDLGETTRVELLDALSSMAICATNAVEYIEGKRHDIVLALAGTLLKSGKSEDGVLRLVDVLCQITGDGERKSRLHDIRGTATRIKNGEPVTQLGRLRELIGERATDDIQRYLDTDEKRELRNDPQAFSGSLDSDDHNDSGVARAFASGVMNRALFASDAATFYAYSEGIWVPDDADIQIGLMFDSFIEDRVDSIRTNLGGVSHKECLEQANFLLRYRNRSYATNAIKQARGFLAVNTGDFDARDDVIAVRNGLLNLRDGSLTPCRPEDYITRRLEVEYDPAADCPNFRKVLSDAFQNDDALISYFKGIMGYWLTGKTDRQEFYILYGEGANGKSTILNALKQVLGSYAGALMAESIFETPTGHHSSDFASMRGCRIGVVHEAESKFRLNSARIKQITGGDWIKVRALYKNPISFQPKFKLVVICNRRPDFDAYDDAFKRRIKLVPFKHTIARENRDPKLGEKLKAEASGILNYMIDGARMYFDDKIWEPGAVKEATQNYIGDHDSVGSFLKDSTLRQSGVAVGKQELYSSYRSYCDDETLSPVSMREFGLILQRLGFVSGRTSDVRTWKGLRLRSVGAAYDETLFERNTLDTLKLVV